MFKLILKFNQAVIKVYEISKPETTFGRKDTNDIQIDNAAVSGSHGKVVKTGDHYEVLDLGSTNGTYVNGRPVKSSRIKNKDQIRVARHILEVWSDEDPPEPEPEKVVKPTAVKPLGATPPEDAAPAAPAEPEPAVASAQAIDMQPVAKTVLPPAYIKVISGLVGSQDEFTIGAGVTYIGTSEQATVKIKGFMAPGLAAAITRRPEGYFLKAVKAGYPKVNGVTVTDQILLETGALIEVGGTNLLFTIAHPTPKENG